MKVNARDWLSTTITVAILALLTLAVSVSAEAAPGPTDWTDAPQRIESPITNIIGGIRRPEVGSHTDSYLYSANTPFGTDVKFWVSMDPTGMATR